MFIYKRRWYTMKRVPDQFIEPDEEESGILGIQDLRMAGGIPCPALTPDEIFRQKELEEKIRQMLDGLSPKEKLVIVMCVMGDKEQEEAAKLLGVTRRKIRSLKLRAMRKLRLRSRKLR
jgi:RNA polymerase sigma factor (sigma-70 family)